MKKIDFRFKKKPKISVIISFFNNCNTLEKSLKSKLLMITEEKLRHKISTILSEDLIIKNEY